MVDVKDGGTERLKEQIKQTLLYNRKELDNIRKKEKELVKDLKKTEKAYWFIAGEKLPKEEKGDVNGG